MQLWALFCALVYQGVLTIEFEEACAGKDFIFPSVISSQMMGKKVIFTPSRGGSGRTVMEEDRVLDPRFIRDKSTVKLLDVSKDYDGRYSAILGWSWHLLSLHVKDCSIKKEIEFGRSFSFEVSRAVEQIDYSPLNDSERAVVRWSRRKAVERPRGVLENRWFVVKKPTYADLGYYTLKDKDGKYIERYRIGIEELHYTHVSKAGEDFTISFPVDSAPFSLTYQPEDRQGHDWLVTLMTDGYLVDIERFEGRIELLSTGVEIRELEEQDGGTFKLKDRDGNLALVVELTVRPLGFLDYGIYIVLIGVVVVVILNCVCCEKRCCCRKGNNATSTPVTLVYQHETTANDQRQSQPYARLTNPSPSVPRGPLVSAANQQPPASDFLSPPPYHVVAGGGGGLGPSSGFAAPAHAGPIPYQSSAVGGVTLGYDCLSSDSGTQFEIPAGLNYPSAPPLSSDTRSCDVYTSDKLNFL